MKRKELIGFLEDVLRGIFVTTNETILYTQKLALEALKSPGGIDLQIAYWQKELKRTDGHPYASVCLNALKELEDPDCIKHREIGYSWEEYKSGEQTADYAEFLTTHQEAITYIADICSGRKRTNAPPELLVFETLKMLSGVQIMGELGFDNETARLTWSLQFLVEEAAYRHAEFKGLDGKDYFATINPQPSIDKVVTI